MLLGKVYPSIKPMQFLRSRSFSCVILPLPITIQTSDMTLKQKQLQCSNRSNKSFKARWSLTCIGNYERYDTFPDSTELANYYIECLNTTVQLSSIIQKLVCGALNRGQILSLRSLYVKKAEIIKMHKASVLF